MKFILLSVFFLTILSADDYYIYKLYNNKYEAIFPKQPQSNISPRGLKFYTTTDTKRQITYLAMKLYLPMSYKQVLKKFGKNHIDKSVKNSIRSMKFNILEFTSTSNINQYKAIYKAEEIKSGAMMYGVVIQDKKNDYRWNIYAKDINYRTYAEDIRDGYKSYFKILN